MFKPIQYFLFLFLVILATKHVSGLNATVVSNFVNSETLFARTRTKCKNAIILENGIKGLTLSGCQKACAVKSECAALEFKLGSKNNRKRNKCRLYRRCDTSYSDTDDKCPTKKQSRCILKRKWKVGYKKDPLYSVKACLTSEIGSPCKLEDVENLRYMQQPTKKCQEAEGQKGSITYVDLILPPGKILFIEVTTNVKGQTSDDGFFVRPSRLTRKWGKATMRSSNTASFYLADNGQFSVEFTKDSIWKNKKKAVNFDALMLFVNPPITLPKKVEIISPNIGGKFTDLGPNKDYLFVAGLQYDWGKDYVFKVHDNTKIYFEKGAYVRGRIIQTEKKVDNIQLLGYGTLDVRYNLEDDLVGISDDATRQNVGIYGQNIKVKGLTLINTNPRCGHFGYCLNINANWSPLTIKKDDPFDAWDLQLKNPPYKYYPAHCQERNMDDSANTDFENCPTSYENGQKVSYIKCMMWQLGQDGINAGKWGIVEHSFVRTVDDAIKPWDSHGIYRNITIWQLTLGWPINFGWWNWNQPDIDTKVEDIYIIHNHNWVTSGDWPETKSGQCIIGGVYGSGAVKRGYRLKNIFIETAASCAVGLQISKNAYSRHPTREGCVGSMIDMKIEGMYFDEEFHQTGGYTNFLSGETKPRNGCVGNLSGKIENMSISGLVAGRPLSVSDFVVKDKTVSGLTFSDAVDPDIYERDYLKYEQKNAYNGNGGIEIDKIGVKTRSYLQCIDRCNSDWSCDCVVFNPFDSTCWKRSQCKSTEFDSDKNYDVYMRVWG